MNTPALMQDPLDPPFDIALEFGEQLPGKPGYYGKWGYPGHNGRDYAKGSGGAPVKAALPALSVRKVGYDPGGYGNYVVLDHGAGLLTYYAHLDSVYVRAGEKGIEQGAVVGTLGATGAVTGPHLHFAVMALGGDPRYKGFVDPRLYLDRSGLHVPPLSTQSDAVQSDAVPLMQCWRLRDGFDYLNIRSGPGVGYADVGDLRPGEKIAGQALGGNDIWVKLVDGRGWVAALHSGAWYLEVAQ